MRGRYSHRVRRRSGRALFERASGPFFECKNERAFGNTQHLMLYRGWRPCRRPLFWLPPAPPEIIKKMMKQKDCDATLFFDVYDSPEVYRADQHPPKKDFQGSLSRRVGSDVVFCAFFMVFGRVRPSIRSRRRSRDTLFRFPKQLKITIKMHPFNLPFSVLFCTFFEHFHEKWKRDPRSGPRA